MLFDQISTDYVNAMKARDGVRSSTLSFLRAQLKNSVIEKRVETLPDSEVIAVIKKQVKQRQDSIAQYLTAGRQDLVNKESAELAVLQAYLPQAMPASELETLVNAAIQEAGASSVKDMGTVMKLVLEKVQGRADSKDVSAAVKKQLSFL